MTPFWTAVPFVFLLLSIAILPLAAPHFWESNRIKGVYGFFVSLPVFVWLLQNHPVAIPHTLMEYFSFICLLGSLFVIAGGIFVTGDLQGTPRVNTLFLLTGAFLANLIGTTGASMILIRPFLRTNSERRRTAHLPVFFIFLVSNCGGLLTPLGDPPLFLGYLRGVPFFWTLRLFPVWITMTGALLVIFYFWDRWAYRHERQRDLQVDRVHIEPLGLQGKRNLIFLLGVLYGVFLPTPWREALMIHMAVLSLVFGPRMPRRRNQFLWRPILEVAVIFAAIFITMVPALMILKEKGGEIGITEPWQFFWLAGSLSSFLDNAPTYLTFLSLAQGLQLSPEVVGVPARLLMAISTGAVLMGANSYIGNGPNFMVKAIADHAGFKTPSFFGYMVYSLIVLFPLYGMVHLIFFR